MQGYKTERQAVRSLSNEINAQLKLLTEYNCQIYDKLFAMIDKQFVPSVQDLQEAMSMLIAMMK